MEVYKVTEAQSTYMQNTQREMLAKGLINLANLLAGVFIVGLSLTENSIAAYVPVIGTVAVGGLYAISYVVLTHKNTSVEI